MTILVASGMRTAKQYVLYTISTGDKVTLDQISIAWYGKSNVDKKVRGFAGLLYRTGYLDKVNDTTYVRTNKSYKIS